MNRVGKLALAPVWAAQVLTGAHSFKTNPVLGSPRLNAWGLHVARVRLAHALADRRRRRLAARISPADRAAFDKDGFILKEDFLPPAAFEALVAEVSRFDGPQREMVQGDAVTLRVALDPENLKALPTAASLLRMPEWRSLIDYVGSFGVEPMTYVQTIVSKANRSGPDPQTHLHQDTFHPTVKAWLFLQDVPLEAGPFVYVRGSHRLTPGRLDWERRMSIAAAAHLDIFTALGSFRIDEAGLAELDLPTPDPLPVRANTLVVADTFGFHARGKSAEPSERVEIWAYGRPNPFWPFTGPDLWNSALLRHRQAQLFWATMDLFERIGLGRNHWKKRPRA